MSTVALSLLLLLYRDLCPFSAVTRSHRVTFLSTRMTGRSIAHCWFPRDLKSDYECSIGPEDVVSAVNWVGWDITLPSQTPGNVCCPKPAKYGPSVGDNTCTLLQCENLGSGGRDTDRHRSSSTGKEWVLQAALCVGGHGPWKSQLLIQKGRSSFSPITSVEHNVFVSKRVSI